MADGRLLETSDLPLERELLRAVTEDAPPSSARRRALVALGLLGVARPVAAAATTASATATSTGAGSVVGWSFIAKWGVAIGLLGAGAAGGMALEAYQRTPRTAAAVVSSSEAAAPLTLAPSPPGPAAKRPAGEDDPERLPVEPDPAAEQALAPTAASPGSRPAGSAFSASVSIRSEINLLDRARTALATGKPEAALAALDEYAARHPRGALREEAAVVRIEALRARGELDAASAAARRFEQRFPGSAHQDRVLEDGSR